VIDKLFTGEWKYYHQASKIVMTLENYKKKVYDLFIIQAEKSQKKLVI
jgi:hypothetical protein